MSKRGRPKVKAGEAANLPPNYDLLPPKRAGDIVSYFERENPRYADAARRLQDRLNYVVSEDAVNPRRWQELQPGASPNDTAKFYEDRTPGGTTQLVELAYSLVDGQITNDYSRDDTRRVRVAGFYETKPIEFMETYVAKTTEDGLRIILMDWGLRLNQPATETLEIDRLERQPSYSLRDEPLSMQESIEKRLREQGLLPTRRSPRHERLNEVGARAVGKMFSEQARELTDQA